MALSIPARGSIMLSRVTPTDTVRQPVRAGSRVEIRRWICCSAYISVTSAIFPMRMSSCPLRAELSSILLYSGGSILWS